MKDLGLLHDFLGLEVWQKSDGYVVDKEVCLRLLNPVIQHWSINLTFKHWYQIHLYSKLTLVLCKNMLFCSVLWYWSKLNQEFLELFKELLALHLEIVWIIFYTFGDILNPCFWPIILLLLWCLFGYPKVEPSGLPSFCCCVWICTGMCKTLLWDQWPRSQVVW